MTGMTGRPTTKSVTSDAHTRVLLEDAVSHGWTVHKQNGHPWIENSGHKVTFSSTPSDHRAVLNTRAQIRKCEASKCQCKGATPIVIETLDKKRTHRDVSTMTTTEVATYFGVTVKAVSRWMREGYIDPIAKPKQGRMTRITIDSVERWEVERAEKRKPGPMVTAIKPSSEVASPPPAPSKPVPVQELTGKQLAQGIRLTVIVAKLEGAASVLGNDALVELVVELKQEMNA